MDAVDARVAHMTSPPDGRRCILSRTFKLNVAFFYSPLPPSATALQSHNDT